VLCAATLQDMPLGNYRELMASNIRKKDTSPNAWKAALLNYRSWVMSLNYGYCFGVELVVDNVITYYLYDQFRLNAVVAGAMGSIFGCVSDAGWASGSALASRVLGFGLRTGFACCT
jgi:NNP family nitrate/nitrite transporter-like MFS transporter